MTDLEFHDVTGFIECPDCAGRGTFADELTPGVVMREACDTCYGHGVIPLCGETTLTLPAELLVLMNPTEVQP
jgi:hypothetical protein